MNDRLDPLRPYLPLIVAGAGWWLFAGSYVLFGVLAALGVPEEGWIPLGLTLMGLGWLGWMAAAVLAARDIAEGRYRYALLAMLVAVPPMLIVGAMLLFGFLYGFPTA